MRPICCCIDAFLLSNLTQICYDCLYLDELWDVVGLEEVPDASVDVY